MVVFPAGTLYAPVVMGSPLADVLASGRRICRSWSGRLQERYGLRHVRQLDPRLVRLEGIFRAPPLTPHLFDAIKRISPHSMFEPDETGRLVWEADQNGACWGEYEAMMPLFDKSDFSPKKILDIGPGMGRSTIFFSKLWKDIEIHAYEGQFSSSPTYPMLGPRDDKSFYGDFRALRHVLDFNDVHNVTVFDAGDIPLSKLPGPYEFLYSFYGIGFHWDLRYFLTDILKLMHDHSIAVFTVPAEFRPFPDLLSLPYMIIDHKRAWPKYGWGKLLVIGKQVSVSECLAGAINQ